MAQINIEETELFGRLRREVGKMYDAYLDRIFPHFEWLDEILKEAKNAFTEPDVELLPRTPSQKRKRATSKRGSIKKRQSSTRKLRSSLVRKSLAFVQNEIAVLAFEGETSATADENGLPQEMAEIEFPPAPLLDPVKEQIMEEYDVISPKAVNAESGDCSAMGSPKEIVVDDVMQTSTPTPPTPKPECKSPMPEEVVTKKEDPPMPMELPCPQPSFQTPQRTPNKLMPATTLTVTSSTKKTKFVPRAYSPHATPSSQTKRFTPQKTMIMTPSLDARGEKIKQQLKEATVKREELLRLRIEEHKRKREERALKVAQIRLLQKAKEEEMKRRIEEKYNTPSTVDLEEKRKLRPRFPNSATKPKENEYKHRQEAEKQKEQRQQQNDAARLKPPEVPEKAENHATKLGAPPSTVTAVAEVFQNLHIKKVPAKVSPATLTVSQPNRKTFKLSKETGAEARCSSSESYDMTPLRPMKPSTDENYDISDLRSSDETDDDENPRKKIPSWAQGTQFKTALIQQFHNPPDLDKLFGVVQMPELQSVFKIQRKRFYKRTSSAKWDSPVHPHNPK